jgi:hypothetical protein
MRTFIDSGVIVRSFVDSLVNFFLSNVLLINVSSIIGQGIKAIIPARKDTIVRKRVSAPIG